MTALAVLSLLLYSLTTGLIVCRWRNTEPSRYVGLASFAAVACHGAEIMQTLPVENGINISFFAASNIVAFWLVLMALVFSLLKPAVQKFLAPILALAAINIVFSALLPTQKTVVPLTTASHIVPSLLAYSVLSLTAAHAVLLWFQNNALKTQRLNRLIDILPPLDVLETILFWMIGVGFALLSLSIVSGMVFIDNFWGQKLAHKSFFAVLSWLIFACLMLGRVVLGWRGTQAIKWTFWGYGCLVLGYFGSKLVVEYIL